MLRNVLIISDAGLVLFSKEFISAVGQPRLVGSLLTAMLEFSTNNVGAPVCYIEMSNVAVSICSSRPHESPGFFAPFGTSASVSSAQHGSSTGGALGASHGSLGASHGSQPNTNTSHGSQPHAAGTSPEKPPPAARHKSDSLHTAESHPSSTSTTPRATPKQTPRRGAGGVTLICALFHDIADGPGVTFHDIADGPDLGRIIATDLLAAFREQFGASLAKVGGGTPHINLNEFDPFHSRIPLVVRGLVAPIVARLVKHAGIELALLLTDDSEIAYCTSDNVDGLGLGSSLAALTSIAEDAMALRRDVYSSVIIEGNSGTRLVGNSGTRLVVRRLSARPATLVVRCSTAVAPRFCNHAVEQSAMLCERYFKLLDNFRM
ncbi:hypothetical protein T484DRAFT_1879296 [Baffinella frigidus]|nr:hypothetical protein T484DRAFT_1879296 [Cryptophyta sp. CCMP2293]